MSKLKSLLLAVPFALLPLKSKSQDNYHVRPGISFSSPHSAYLKEDFKTFIGPSFHTGKQIAKDVNAEIGIEYLFSKSYDQKESANFFGIGPTIIWQPTFGNSNTFYFGAGLKYKNLNVSWKKTTNGLTSTDSESINGLGFEIKFGSEIKLGQKASLYFETAYDKVEAKEDGDEIDLGQTKLTFGVRF